MGVLFSSLTRVKALSYLGFKAPYDLNHKAHQEHKGKEKLFSVLFVCFVVPIQISQPVSIASFTGLSGLSQCH